MSETHDGKFAGHFSEQKDYNLLRKMWDGMRADIMKYRRSCLIVWYVLPAKELVKAVNHPYSSYQSVDHSIELRIYSSITEDTGW